MNKLWDVTLVLLVQETLSLSRYLTMCVGRVTALLVFC